MDQGFPNKLRRFFGGRFRVAPMAQFESIARDSQLATTFSTSNLDCHWKLSSRFHEFALLPIWTEHRVELEQWNCFVMGKTFFNLHANVNARLSRSEIPFHALPHFPITQPAVFLILFSLAVSCCDV